MNRPVATERRIGSHAPVDTTAITSGEPLGIAQVNEIIAAGHQFFGQVSGGLATMVERIVSRYGLPNGYIIGQEGSGAHQT